MKIRIILAIIVLAGLLSCTKTTPLLLKNEISYSNISIPQASNTPYRINVYAVDSTQSYTINAFYGGPVKPSKDIKITFRVNPQMLDTFNLNNGTMYGLLPSDAYNLEKTNVVIPANSLSSESLNINIITTMNFPVFTTFILPITIESSDAPINKKLGIIYFQVTASYSPGNIPRKELFHLSGDPESIFAYKNAIFEHRKTGEIYRFPYSQIKDEFDPEVQLNDAGWGTSLQWLTPLNDYLWGMGVNGSNPIGTAYGYIYVYKFLEDGSKIRMDGFTGNVLLADPTYDLMIPFKNSMLFRTSLGANITMYNTNGAFSLTTKKNIEGEWKFTSIFQYGNDLFCVEANGDLWQYPLTEDGVVGSRTKIGSGWDLYTKVFAFNDKLIGVDKDNKLWMYNFDIRAFWALK